MTSARFSFSSTLILYAATAFAAGDSLDQQVLKVFQNRCVVCHDGSKDGAAGDVGFLLDLVQLSDSENGYIDSDTPGESYLAEIILDGSMPAKRWKDAIWNGPLTDSEKESVLAWVRRGGPSTQYREEAAREAERNRRELIPEREIVRRIARDLAALDGAQLRNARYLTICNLHNLTDVSASDLDLYRDAIVKMLNSLSGSSDVVGTDESEAFQKVVAIDKERTIFRFDLRHVGWSNADWQRTARYYPYALMHQDGLARSVYTLTDSDYPYLRADWFVFATSQPPLYHDLVGIPSSLQKLEATLQVDRIQRIRRGQVARAGFARSKVSVNNRLIERISFPGGYYHISYDFASNDQRANFFDYPLGPVGALETDFAFKHDGGEVVYRLPNGFQAYALVEASGRRLSIAPSAIVHDDSMPGGAIINGISCMSCHYDGIKPENAAKLATLDEVRESVSQNFRRFRTGVRDQVRELYPTGDQFSRLLESDRASFRTALTAAGIKSRGPDEPIRAIFDRFAQNLDVATVAADFGITVEEFGRLLNRESETREIERRLKTEGLQRQLYVSRFRMIAQLTGLGELREFTPLPLPYFGADPEAELREQGTARTENPPERQASLPGNDPEDRRAITVVKRNKPKIPFLDDDNHNGDFAVTVGSGDGRKHFSDGEKIPCVVKANRDCFLTLLGIDQDGTVNVLVPNKWHPQLKLRAGRSLRIPTDEMGFEFQATKPHGPTQLRVIATRTPFDIEGVGLQELEQSESGFVSLGTRESIGLRGISVARRKESKPSTSPARTRKQSLSDLYAPEDWTTSRWTFITHE